MVATKRGVRVSFPTKTNAEQLTDVQATPSTGRRTRRAVKPAESPTRRALAETRCQLERTEGGPPEPSSAVKKRCTRASRLHSPQQPSTPVGSVHEADTSDLESCCSAVSDVEPSVTRSGRRRGGRGRQPRVVSQEDEDPSEVESCSSAVSASKPVQASRRSTRRRTVPRGSAAADAEAADVDSSRRVTRSQRKATRGGSSAKQKTEDSELSDADSCASGTHGAEVSKSTTRRATRSTRERLPIPLHLDEPSEGSRSPSRTSRRTRAARGTAAVAVDASEPPFCDSEGFESGPTYSVTTRRSGRTRSTGPRAADSDSDATVRSPAGSPSPSRGKGTPCSSRTGSGSSGSGRSAAATRRSVKDCSVVLELGWGPAEEDDSTDDSRLESTVIAKDADRTLLEEEERQTSEEPEDANDADRPSGEADAKREGKEADVLSVEGSHASPSVPDSAGRTAEDVGEPAVIVTGQQEELSAEDKDGETSEMEVMQQTFPPSEPVKPCQSVAVTTREKASEITGEVEEKHEAADAADADIRPSQEDEPLDEDAVVEMQPSAEEEMEASRVKSDAQRAVESSEVHVEFIQATSSQQHKVTVESDSERQPKDIVVQNAKIISLLDSSDDEDEPDEAGEREVSDEDDLGHAEEERGGPSSRSTAAAASVEGLFMVDTRPGQDVDEEYYREQPGEEEEDTNTEVELEEQDEEFVDEEFVDEEGDDDDDDDADILFSSRNPQLKEMSSRIDPGIRGKELLGLYISFDGSKSKPVSDSLLKLKEKKMQDEVMKKSVITPDFEKKDAVPPYSESKRAVKLKHRAEREKSTGDGWFNMKAPEMSQELKGDLQVLKMRGSMDPKRFYKKNDREGFPKYFQVGTVVDSAVDFYHSRVPKKQRKRTMVEELLADAEFRHNNKKRYQQIVTEKAAQGAGKRNKKKNKFRKK
ncbi:deoxynucleotidyltransferase terminal-interacting protein 2 [Embiotoca jacksoni]|uniref:deoxynucleotidyltransferase terminal-interacting protein 2 n=1 Tax=Embiotoca jacksoni TaxID=100190 RepID=UPI0037046F07